MSMKRILMGACAAVTLGIALAPATANAGCRTVWAYDHWERQCWAPVVPAYYPGYAPPPPRWRPPPPRWRHHHHPRWHGGPPGRPHW
ncbi:hypothetical protein [Chitinasiproducens palmae]|uniref:Lipoprotein n=1 Tax=Chitinasiproducens palmae TaxID=1770053 RepID=A0A1H2PTK3_9BURK|nr:hypothetical protein [Chitinasiproducens palmae]SDV50056.1 hypothetical protein SAMN05216551_11083 [Chitinasiproducens palmae]